MDSFGLGSNQEHVAATQPQRGTDFVIAVDLIVHALGKSQQLISQRPN